MEEVVEYDEETGEPLADYMGNTMLRRPPPRDDSDTETTEFDPNSGDAIKRVLRRKLNGGATARRRPT